MRHEEMEEILEQHTIWVESFHKKGERANFNCEDLTRLNFRGTNLSGAIFKNCYMQFVDLSDANLSYADFSNADLLGANLNNANLRYVNFHCANLNGVELRFSNLEGANLYRAILPDSTFVITGEKYFISIVNGNCVRACHESYLVDEWRNFSKEDLLTLDRQSAVDFYPRLLDIIDFYCGKGERPAWLQK